MASIAQLFGPDHHYDRISTVDLDALYAEGIRGSSWTSTTRWWRGAGRTSRRTFLAWAHGPKPWASNSALPAIPAATGGCPRLRTTIGASYVTGVTKPRRGGFRNAAWKMGLANSQVAVVGDQLLTDILGAKRLGVKAILVDKLAKKEFIVTQFNRQVERAIRWWLVRTGKLPPMVRAVVKAAEETPVEPGEGTAKDPTQWLKPRATQGKASLRRLEIAALVPVGRGACPVRLKMKSMP